MTDTPPTSTPPGTPSPVATRAPIAEPPAARRPLSGPVGVHTLMDPHRPYSTGGDLGVLDLPSLEGLKKLREADVVLATDTKTGEFRTAKGAERFGDFLHRVNHGGLTGTLRVLSVELDFDTKEFAWLLTAAWAAQDMDALDELPDPDP